MLKLYACRAIRMSLAGKFNVKNRICVSASVICTPIPCDKSHASIFFRLRKMSFEVEKRIFYSTMNRSLVVNNAIPED